MSERNSSLILGALDECIEEYSKKRRERIDRFVQSHFSLHETFQIQKKSFSVDLFLNPLNALWAIPYLSIKKSIETLDKLGWAQLTPFMDMVPSGIKTGYQKQIERLIENELLECNSLLKDIAENPILGKVLGEDQLSTINLRVKKEIASEIEKYSSSQAMISDLSGSVLTLLAGWMFFGDKTLGVFGIGNKIARKMAHDKAASGFFLGKNLGSAFYNAFPPIPSQGQVFLATLGVGIVLTALSLLTSIMSDPLRKKLGIHEKKLNLLVDSLEEKLFLYFRKEIKKSFKNSELLPQAS